MSITTTNLVTSKLLKQAGFCQDTDFYYSCNHFEEAMAINKDDAYHVHYQPPYRRDFSSPTTDEILSHLPWRINQNKYPCDLMITKGPKNYHVRYVNPVYLPKKLGWNFDAINESLPDCLASMWLYLKSEGLIK